MITLPSHWVPVAIVLRTFQSPCVCARDVGANHLWLGNKLVKLEGKEAAGSGMGLWNVRTGATAEGRLYILLSSR